MRNKEEIKGLTVWDLAEFLYKVSNHETKITVCNDKCDYCLKTRDWCVSEIAEWLNSEKNSEVRVDED